MVYVPKVPSPLDEIEIEVRFPRLHTASSKPYLIVSLDCLTVILDREDSVIAKEDIPRLLAVLCRCAVQSDIGDTAMATHLAEDYENYKEPDP
jgi:hypothetical protein